jgi:ankyrin repeat protein
MKKNLQYSFTMKDIDIKKIVKNIVLDSFLLGSFFGALAYGMPLGRSKVQPFQFDLAYVGIQFPLHLAVRNGDYENLLFLLENSASRANINQTDNEGYTALHLAVRGGYDALVQLLIENGANVNQPDPHGFTPLHSIILSGNFGLRRNSNDENRDPEILALLISAPGVDVNKLDRNGRTPLDLAVFNKGGAGIAQLLMANGARRGAELNQP